MTNLNSKIEWTDITWSPVVGCTHVSPGCDHCYAARLASGRLRHQPTYAGLAEDGRFNGTVRLLPERLVQPLGWRKPRRVFVNSMSDLFHGAVPDEFIAEIFAVMAAAHEHTFQLLTKRHARMRRLLNDPDFQEMVKAESATLAQEGVNILTNNPWETWPLRNVWIGVSAETQPWADIRIPALLDTPAAVRFVSAEPLLGPINLEMCDWTPPQRAGFPGVHNPLSGEWWPAVGDALEEYEWRITDQPRIDWVIVGGESGPGARPMHPDWARSIRDQCTTADVPFFFKQWGAWAPGSRPPNTVVSEAVVARDDGQVYEPASRLWEETPASEHDRVNRKGWDLVHRPPSKRECGRRLDGLTWDQYPGGAS